jgi:hypothetical protein
MYAYNNYGITIHLIAIIIFNVITLVIIIVATGKLDPAHILYPNNPTANEERSRPVLKSHNGRFRSDQERHARSEVSYP